MLSQRTGLLIATAIASVSFEVGAQDNLLPAPAGAEIVPGQFICVFDERHATLRSGVGSEARFAALDANGAVGRVFSHSIRGFVVQASPQGVRQMLLRNPQIAYCEPDKIMRLDPQAPPPGRGKNKNGDDGSSGQVIPWGISRAGGAVDATGAAARGWVIDSGIDLNHPDLNVDRSRSVDFTRSRKGADDENGHGTHVAGTIAAIDNDIGVIGVAAGATLIAVKVLDRRGNGTYSGVIEGVDYVAANAGAGDVANMSLGGPYSQALNDAVLAAAEKGIDFTLAAGNSAAHAGNYSPASADSPPGSAGGTYTVSAFQDGDVWASFSNYGNPPVDFAEPGVAVLSTYKNGGYETLNGTSMAAPHLAGILLLTAGNGGPNSIESVANDPDGNPDPIGVR